MKQLLLILLIGVGLIHSVHGQNRILDSLKKVNLKKLNDTQIINYYNDLSWEYAVINTDSALLYALKAIHLSEKQNDLKFLIESRNMYAAALRNAGKLKEAEKEFLQAISSAQNYPDRKKLASLYINLGNVYYQMGNKKEVIECYTKGLKIVEERNDKKYLILVYSNLAAIFNEYGLTEKAIEYSKKAIEYNKIIKDDFQEASMLINLGNILLAKNANKDAEEKYDKSISILETKYPNTESLAIAYMQKAAVLKQTNRSNESINLYDKALKIFQNLKNEYNIAMCQSEKADVLLNLNNLQEGIKILKQTLQKAYELEDEILIASNNYLLAKGYLAQKKFDEAIKHAAEGIVYSKKLQDPEKLLEGYEQLIFAYRNLKNFSVALQYADTFRTVSDSVFTQQTTQNIANLQVVYNLDAKERQIEKLEAQRKIANLELSKQRWFLAAALSTILLIALILAIVYRNTRILNQKNEELNKQKLIIEDRNKTLEESNKTISKQKHIIEEKQKEILDSINYALRIQQAILPSFKTLNENLPQGFILYKPKDIVAGDFYWFSKKSDYVYFAVADCTGHGVPGAFVSLIAHNALNKALSEFKKETPADILNTTREIILHEFSKNEANINDGMDISLLRINSLLNEYQWAGANHNLWIIGANGFYEIKGDKQPIGKFSAMTNFTNHVLTPQEGSTLYLFTDGYPDQFGGPNGKKFKTSQLKNLLNEIYSLTPDEQKIILENTFNSWQGLNEQVDDVTIAGIKV